MNRKGFRIMMVLAFSLALLSTAWGQGLYWESTISSSSGSMKDQLTKAYYIPKMFKVESPAESAATILRMDKQLMLIVNNKEKTYSEMTFSELEAMMKSASGQMDEMQKKMEKLPPETREMMKKMMGDKMMKKESTVSVKKTDNKKTISGYPCVEYVITEDGKERIHLWVTSDIKGFDLMGKDFEEFGSRMAALNPIGGKSLADGMKQLKGFPIQTIFGDITTTVTKIEERATPPSAFDPPPAYKKVEHKMGGMGEMHK
jgi:hypothetical protein